MPRSTEQPIRVGTAVSTSPDRRSVFISYSHKDAQHLTQLRLYLDQYTPHDEMMRSPIDVWDDTKIAPGNIWRNEIQAALASAKVAVLLVSVNFFGSGFIREVELPALLNAAEADGLVILPVILSACAFKESRLGIYQSVNEPSTPLEAMNRSKQNKIWQKVAAQVADVLDPSKLGNEKVHKPDAGRASSLDSRSDVVIGDMVIHEDAHATSYYFTLIHYLNLPRLLTVDPDASSLLAGITTTSHGPATLRDMGLGLARLVHNAQSYFRRWTPPALDITALDDMALTSDQAVGVLIRFDALFTKGKNIPFESIYDDKQVPFRLTGTIKKDPHICCKTGRYKIIFPLSPRWITTDTAVSDLAGYHGRPRLAGLGVIKYLKDDLIVATPLVLGTAVSPFMQAWNDMMMPYLEDE